MTRFLSLLVLLCFASVAHAQNDVLLKSAATLAFVPQEGTEDCAFDFDGLASASAYRSCIFDLGTADKEALFELVCVVQFETDPVVDEEVALFLVHGDGTRRTHDDGTTTGALSSLDKLGNLKQILTITVDEVSQTAPMVGITTFRFHSREIGLVVHNTTADAISSTTTEVGCYLTPKSWEIQP